MSIVKFAPERISAGNKARRDGKSALAFRRRRMVRTLLLLVFSLSAGFGRANDLSSKENGVAQKLYTAKCAKCHKFYDPKSYGQAEWDLWMQKMGKKSKLKPEQVELLS